MHDLSLPIFSLTPSRFVWNFFRLENEHLNNCGEFRAVRDISVAPMNADDQTLLEQMMDQDDGVKNRAKSKTWKRSTSISLRRPRLSSLWVRPPLSHTYTLYMSLLFCPQYIPSLWGSTLVIDHSGIFFWDVITMHRPVPLGVFLFPLTRISSDLVPSCV